MMPLHPAENIWNWTKSSFSDGGANCVLVGRSTVHQVGLRDSKVPHIPAITVSAETWFSFVDALKAAPANHRVDVSSPSKAELYALDLADLTWISPVEIPAEERIEIADLPGGAVAVRISTSTVTLRYTHGEWDAFVRGVKAGEFDMAAAA